MGNFTVLAGDTFGFEQVAKRFIYTFNYHVPVNILPGSIGYQVPQIIN